MKKIDKDLKKIVLARLSTFGEDYRLIIGNQKPIGKSELIKQVESETELGKKIAAVELGFLKDLISGKIYKAIG